MRTKQPSMDININYYSFTKNVSLGYGYRIYKGNEKIINEKKIVYSIIPRKKIL